MSIQQRSTVSLRQGETAAALVLLVFGLAVLAGALVMPLGNAAEPGPGVLPAALGFLLAATSVVLLLRARRLEGEAAQRRLSFAYPRIWLTLAVLAVLAWWLESLGYIASAALFLLVLLRSYSRLGWPALIASALGGAVVSYYALGPLLGVQLPAGFVTFF